MVAVIAAAAAKAGAELVGKAVGGLFGERGGELAETVVTTVAERLGVEPAEIPAVPPGRIEEAVRSVETEMPDIILAHLQQQKATHDFVIAQKSQTPRWVPAWQWFIMFLWAFAWVFVPIGNSLGGLALPAPATADLIWLTTCYQMLNMGGNTALRLADKWLSRK
jgi:hypothetical protein